MEIPSYPPPPGALDGTELVLGFSGGATRRITTQSLLTYFAAAIAAQALPITLIDEATGQSVTGVIRLSGGVLTFA